MSNLKNIGNKLFKETTELKSHDVELALVDDAKKIRGEFASVAEKEDGYFGFVVKAELEGQEALREYKQLLKKIESITPKLENAINELGINRNNFGVLEDLDNAKSKVKERISKISKNVNKLKSINP